MNAITEKTKDILAREDEYLSYTTRAPYYPLVVKKAQGCMVEDIEGNQFLDLLASAAVMNTGHNHPRVLKAIMDQAQDFIHYTPAYMYHKPHTDLAQRLTEITPGNFPKRVAFATTGSESCEGAVKAAKVYTGRNKIVSFLHSYHGTTMGALSVSGYTPQMRMGLGNLVPGTVFIPYPDCYRCLFGQKEESCDLECMKYFKELMETVAAPSQIAAVIYEVIQGDAGVIVPPLKYMEELYRICQANRILMIADEVQTGFGRTGKLFASEHFPFQPDITVLGKAIASGMPLSAVVARKEILESWSTPMHFFNMAGNAVACAASLATIQVIEEEGLVENSRIQGEYLMEGFRRLQMKFECIGDVRGRGLLIGVDIVKNRRTKERDVSKTAKICWRCWEKGLILAFFNSAVLRIAPPLTINRGEVEQALRIIEEAMEDVELGKVPDSAVRGIKGL